MTRDIAELLILGLGNTVCGDDGLGVIALNELEHRYTPPEGVRLLDGGTLGLSLLPHLTDSKRAILVDAISADQPVGSLIHVAGDDVMHAANQRLSVHQVGVMDLLNGAILLEQLPELVLIGLVPGTLDLSTELTKDVQRGIPSLVDAVVTQCAAWGFPLQPKT